MSEEAKTEAAPAAKSKPPIKLIAIVGAIMVLEGAGVAMFVSMTGKAPDQAHAADLNTGPEQDLDRTIEVPLMEEKFQNLQTGRVWFWDTSIVLVIKASNETLVNDELDRRKAEIAEGISMLFRKAQHGQLKEPGLETINRQLTSHMNRILGKDAEGNDRLVRVVIPKCRGIQAD